MAERKCKKCGCTEHQACLDEEGNPCYWVSAELCSACTDEESD